MDLILNMIKFIIYSILIVIITKKFLIKTIRTLASALNLDSKIVGDIAGLATSVPELISVFFTSMQGMFSAVIFNILSSNVINAIQYTFSIYWNKNQRFLDNQALKSDIVMVIITILIPIWITVFNVKLNLAIIPVFIMLFILFYVINRNSHKLYLSNIKTEETEEIEKEKRWVKGKKKIIVRNSILLVIIGVALFFIGELLGGVVKSLSVIFNISEAIIGIALGFITSIPELITFIEAQRHSKKNKNNISGVVESTNNLLTSNMINLFIVLTIGIIVTAML